MLCWRSCFAVSLALLFGTVAQAQDKTAMLYQKVVRSAVYIVKSEGGGFSSGSGSLLDREQRILITNHHVVDDADWVFVAFPVDDEKGNMITDKNTYMKRIREEKGYKAKVLKVDPKRDLAILQLEKAPPPETPALPLAAKEPGQGTEVWNIGSPGAVDQLFSITPGNVRAVGKEKFDIGEGKTAREINARMLTTTNPVNHGDSGGPLVNSAGELVAVTQSGYSGTVKAVNHFVSVEEVKEFLKENKITVKVTPPEVVKKVEPPKKETPNPKETPKPKDTATPAAEKAATDALKLAKLLANNEDNRERYIDKLGEIVKKYPGTTSAKEAQRLLDGLKK